ncbi:MAG: arsenate reductase ArsC [Nitrospirota bacterium]|nr:arsenate reductase ArsC [Nitrospirota bacterium]
MDLPKVLFVCVENACRSQMAEAFLRMAGAGEVHALSAGSRPAGQVNPRATVMMAEVGYDLTAHRSTGLDEIPPGPYQAVVTMGCGDACPNVAAAIREDWNIPDPKEMPTEQFRQVRDQIGRRVRVLLERVRALAEEEAEQVG